jgi:carbon monoxide dehydrogenase subunit G
MRFENEFEVDAPADEVFDTLLDLEKVAPAMPGAQVTDKVGDDAYKVAIKVKLGPMTMNYSGDVEIREKDPQAHRAVLHVKAREARGQGTATADVTMQLEERDGGTHARMEADVQLAGKAAAMGRGLIEDVSKKLVDQFAQNLQKMLSAPQAAEPDAGAAAPREAAAAAPEGGRQKADGGADASPPQAAEPEGLDALGLASGIAADKLRDPRVLAAAVGGALFVGYLLGRR